MARKRQQQQRQRQQLFFFFFISCVVVTVITNNIKYFHHDPFILYLPTVESFALRTTTTTTRTTRLPLPAMTRNPSQRGRRQRQRGSLESTMGTSSSSSSTLFHSTSSATYLDSISYPPPTIIEDDGVENENWDQERYMGINSKSSIGLSSNYLDALSSASAPTHSSVDITGGADGSGSGSVMESTVSSTTPLIESLMSGKTRSPMIPLLLKEDDRVMMAEEQQQQQQVATAPPPPPPPVVAAAVASKSNKARSPRPDGGGGLFAPAVLFTKDIVGETKLKKLRATIIGMHADVIGDFTSTAQTEFGNQVLKALFALADQDNNGTIDEEEFTIALQSLGFDFLKPKQIAGIFKRADGDKNGTLDFEEWEKAAPKLLKVNLTLLAKKNGHDLGFMA